MAVVIEIRIEERFAGGEPRQLVDVCAFSGCTEPSDRFDIDTRWRLCREHADNVEEARRG